MPIGYYNFGNVMAGNQQVVNSLAGLGQQISGAIENHAQMQAAQAMLPTLKESYAQGMQKIASGDPNGMADIYGAAASASQIPMLAGFAKNAITTAQSANINAQHMARTQAYLLGKQQNLYGQFGSGLMQAPEGMNPNWQGKQALQRTMTPYQQAEVAKSDRQAKVNQINSYNSLYSGTDKDAGIGSLAQKIQDSINSGSAPDPADIRNFASKISAYKQAQGAYGNNAIPSPDIEAAYQQVQSQIPALNEAIKKENAKDAGYFSGRLFGIGGKDPKKIGQMEAGVQQLQGLGGMPSVKAQQVAPQQQDQDAEIQKGNATFNSPDDVKSAFQSGKISQDQAVQLLQAFPVK